MDLRVIMITDAEQARIQSMLLVGKYIFHLIVTVRNKPNAYEFSSAISGSFFFIKSKV